MTTGADDPSWDELIEEAAGWLARMDSGAADPADFEAWRAADPRRAVAFAQVARTTRMLDRSKPAIKPTLKPPVRRSRRKIIMGAVAATVTAGATVFALTSFQARKASAKTTVGGRKTVALPDGNRIELNTDTAVEWLAGSPFLELTLERGEMAIAVPTGGKHCLLLSPHNVAELGSGQFNARLRGEVLDLTVLSGRCEVWPRDAVGRPSKRTVVEASQGTLATKHKQVLRHLPEAAIEQVSAWKSGELVFHGQTLETVVGEYNRYLSRKITIADPVLAGTIIGGRFTTRDPQVFLSALKDGFGIIALDDGASTIVLTR